MLRVGLFVGQAQRSHVGVENRCARIGQTQCVVKKNGSRVARESLVGLQRLQVGIEHADVVGFEHCFIIERALVADKVCRDIVALQNLAQRLAAAQMPKPNIWRRFGKNNRSQSLLFVADFSAHKGLDCLKTHEQNNRRRQDNGEIAHEAKHGILRFS